MAETLAAVLEENARLRAELAQAREALTQAQSVCDELTGLRNRRYFGLLFMDEQRRAHREGRTLTLLLAQVDNFQDYKQSDDGHAAGERALKAVAGAIGAALNRPGDLAFRIGTDQFACLFVTTVERESMELAERIREQLAACAIMHPGNAPHGVATLSAGLAFLRPDCELSLEQACDVAGHALQRAHDNGRNAIAR